MGYDERQQPNSSGTLVAMLGVGLVLAILAIIDVAAVGLFWVRAARMESRARAVAEEHRAVIELRAAEVKRNPSPPCTRWRTIKARAVEQPYRVGFGDAAKILF